MPNDSKLGLIAGLAGVIVVAVLFFQDRPAAPVAALATAPAAAKPAHLFRARPEPTKPRVPQPATVPVQVRPEPEAKKVSRGGE